MFGSLYAVKGWNYLVKSFQTNCVYFIVHDAYVFDFDSFVLLI